MQEQRHHDHPSENAELAAQHRAESDEAKSETDQLLDEIDAVLEEAAALRDKLREHSIDDDLLDEIDSLLVHGLAKGFVQVGGE